MNSYAWVVESHGEFYIRPVQVQCYNISFKTKTDAETVARALNLAVLAGREKLQSDLRELLALPEKNNE